MSSAARRGVVSSLQGPRPLPLSLPSSSSSPPPRPAKRPRDVNSGDDDDDVRVRAAPPAAEPGPVILYEHTPKVIHARPDEFKALVQRLTGRQPTGGAPGRGGDQDQEAVLRPPAQTAAAPSWPQQKAVVVGDPLVLTLGQQQQAVPPPPLPPLDDHHRTSGGAAGFLLSPGSFIFSPATMQVIQELIS